VRAFRASHTIGLARICVMSIGLASPNHDIFSHSERFNVPFRWAPRTRTPNIARDDYQGDPDDGDALGVVVYIERKCVDGHTRRRHVRASLKTASGGPDPPPTGAFVGLGGIEPPTSALSERIRAISLSALDLEKGLRTGSSPVGP
jgi:hypothetical protein